MGLLTSSRRRMALGLGLALFFILCEVLLTFQSLRRQEQSYNWVRHTLQVQVQLESILSALMQAQAGQRDYLLTRNAQSLELYRSGTQALSTAAAEVRSLTRDNPSQQHTLDTLEPLLYQRLEQLEWTIQRAEGGQAEQALAFVRTGQGMETQGSIQRLVDAMQAEEQRLLKQREQAWKSAASTSIALRLTGSGLLLTLAVLAATLSWRGYQTERRMARRALNESWDQLLSIIDNAPAIIYAKDPQGRYLFVNRRFESLFGLPREQIAGHTDHEYLPREVADDFRANDRQVLERQAPVEVEELVPHPDGLHTYLSVKFPLTDSEGRLYAVCGISTDITERKQMAEYEQRLLGIVGHDLRSPLAAITASAQYLLRTGRLDEVYARPVRRISHAAERMRELITRMLDYTRRRAGEPLQVSLQYTCVSDIAATVVDDFNSLRLERTLELSVEGDTCGQFDPVRLGQLLSNLLDNAVKYSPLGSTVRIVLRGEDRHLLLSVHNEGEPIPERLLPHLFEPFRRGDTGSNDDTVRLSAGLGLYIVHGIVESHGGTLEVESTREAGTTFKVRLPRHPAASATSTRQPSGSLQHALRVEGVDVER